MASTGIEIWRPLLSHLRTIARAGVRRPSCYGVQDKHQQHSCTFTWTGMPPPGPPKTFPGIPPISLPDNSISLTLNLDGDQVLCGIHIYVSKGGSTALYKDTERLEKLIASLCELAQMSSMIVS